MKKSDKKLDKELDVEDIAHLARIKLSAAEIDSFKAQFSDILSYIDKLNKLDTSGVAPTSHILPVKNVFREDIVSESMTPEEALKNAPQKKNNLFKVPKIVE